jgi:transposase
MIDPARLHAAQSRIRECIDRGLPPSPADLQICLASQDAPTLDTLLMAALARLGQLEAEMAVLRRELEALRAAQKEGRHE